MTYPLPAFHFRVEWGGASIGFSEVSGLDVQVDVIEYREGSSPSDSTVKLPGLRRFANVTLKRGMAEGDNDFFAWLNTVRTGKAERRDIVIALLDEKHQPATVWRLRNAWPVRLVGPQLDAMQSALAIEALELAHEGLTVETV